MTSHIALESLVQRGRSIFYTDLISVYQKAHDALYEAKNASDDNIVKLLNGIKFDKDLRVIIEKHTGFPIARAGVIGDMHPNLKCFLIERPAEKNKKAHPKTTGMALAEVASSYNDRTGRINNPLPLKDSNFAICIFVTSGVFKIREPNGSFTFTPEELAALTLHEVGHADMWIRVGLRAQASLLNTSDMVEYVSEQTDPKVLLDLVSKLQANKEIRRTWGKTLGIIAESLQTQNGISETQAEALSALSLIIIEHGAAEEGLILQSPQAIDYHRQKTTLFSVDEERSADDYATRHGSAGPLVNALTKFDRMETSDTERYAAMVLGVDVPVILGFLMKFRMQFSVAPEEITQGYDPLIRRLELIVETAKHAFHDDKLPPEIAKGIRADIVKAQAYLDSYRNADHRKTRVLLKQWKDNVEKFGRLVNLPFQNRTSVDYAKLQDANRSLGRNPLYYLANK